MRSLTNDPVHRVQFYSDPAYLTAQIAKFIEPALARGAAFVVARPEHRDLVERLLAAHHDVAALKANGKLTLIDAEQMLDAILSGALLPTRARFEANVGVLLDHAEANGANEIRIYGEMVDVAWARGNAPAALRLEQLWIELLDKRPAWSLLCGYRLERFDRDAPGFDAVCDQHQTTAVEHDSDISGPHVVARLEHRARLLETEVQRRIELERRMLELLEITGRIHAAKTRDEIARLTVENGAKAVGAVEAALWLFTPDRSQLQLLVATPGSVAVSAFQSLPLDDALPLAQVVRTGEPIFFGSRAVYAERFPASYARMAKNTQHQAFALLPVIADHEPLGALVFGYDHERAFEGPDRAFKAILARQCALALERTTLHDEERALREAAEQAAVAERAARSDIELLYELIAAANQLDQTEAVFEVALDTVIRGSRCDRAAILLFDPDGVMRFKASRGLSETYQRTVEGHTPWNPDEQSPTPIAVDDTEADPAWASYRDVFRAEGIRALAFVPLVHHRKLIGKFMLYGNAPRAFEVRDLQFAATVAVHVAQAIERHRAESELERAYREEREAHMLADEAIRAREEIISVVSHDLRGPLGTVMLGATTLLELGDRGHRTRTVAERIHRQASRMARLIEDLVDFAGIQAGRLAISRTSQKPEDIIAATCDMFSTVARENGLRFETLVLPDLPAIECDPDRAVQVMSNLVSNALKVTPKGGAIAIGAEPKNKEVVFYVRDTGPGIAADELPRLFERYWRSKQPSYKGAGLGLSIARGIVDAHGGRIWAESQIGVGSTFYFSLQSLAGN